MSLLDTVFLLWIGLASFVSIVWTTYLLLVLNWLRIRDGRDLKEHYTPNISILIPAYNESSIIAKKLRNIDFTTYPKELLEVFLIDGASTDDTAGIAERFVPTLGYHLKVVRENIRDGKVFSLNRVLPHCTGEIIVVSDADSLLDADALTRLVLNFSDFSIGAVTGYKYPIMKQPGSTEKVYRDITNTFRIAESRLYATFIFQGELAAFRRSSFDQFAMGCDDSGTAFDILKNGYRAIEDENAKVYEHLPQGKKMLFRVRSRRARCIIDVCFSALRLFRSANSKLKQVILFNFLIHVIIPVAILILIILSPIVFLYYRVLLAFFPMLGVLYIVNSTRTITQTVITFLASQLALLNGLLLYIRGNKMAVWKPAREQQLGNQ